LHVVTISPHSTPLSFKEALKGRNIPLTALPSLESLCGFVNSTLPSPPHLMVTDDPYRFPSLYQQLTDLPHLPCPLLGIDGDSLYPPSPSRPLFSQDTFVKMANQTIKKVVREELRWEEGISPTKELQNSLFVAVPPSPTSLLSSPLNISGLMKRKSSLKRRRSEEEGGEDQGMVDEFEVFFNENEKLEFVETSPPLPFPLPLPPTLSILLQDPSNAGLVVDGEEFALLWILHTLPPLLISPPSSCLGMEGWISGMKNLLRCGYISPVEVIHSLSSPALNISTLSHKVVNVKLIPSFSSLPPLPKILTDFAIFSLTVKREFDILRPLVPFLSTTLESESPLVKGPLPITSSIILSHLCQQVEFENHVKAPLSLPPLPSLFSQFGIIPPAPILTTLLSSLINSSPSLIAAVQAAITMLSDRDEIEVMSLVLGLLPKAVQHSQDDDQPDSMQTFLDFFIQPDSSQIVGEEEVKES